MDKIHKAIENIPESLYRHEGTDQMKKKYGGKEDEESDEEGIGGERKDEEEKERLKWTEAWDEMIGGKIITMEDTQAEGKDLEDERRNRMMTNGIDRKLNGIVGGGEERQNGTNAEKDQKMNEIVTDERSEKEPQNGENVEGSDQRNGTISGNDGVTWAEQHLGDDGQITPLSPTVPLTLEEADAKFWFSALPKEDTPASRRELLRTVFSPGWRSKWQLRPFAVLKAFAQRFWPRPEHNRLVAKPVILIKFNIC